MASSHQYRLRFLADCKQNDAALKELAGYYKDAISVLLKQRRVFVHDVDARVKSSISLAQKLRRKKYRRPRQQMNDVIGVRVITYFRDDVERVKQAITSLFDINTNKSILTREHRALNQKDVGFGYDSVHIVARMTSEDSSRSRVQRLRNPWIEIQIRSILEHSWSEIEHEIVYKPSVLLSSEIKRKFGAIAAALELIDSEFITLRTEISKKLELWKVGLENRSALRRSEFDVIGMIASYAVLFPGAPAGMAPLSGIITPEDISCYYALKYAGVSTFLQLRKALRRADVRNRINAAAATRGLPANGVSYHLITALIGSALRPRGFNRQFPELRMDA